MYRDRYSMLRSTRLKLDYLDVSNNHQAQNYICLLHVPVGPLFLNAPFEPFRASIALAASIFLFRRPVVNVISRGGGAGREKSTSLGRMMLFDAIGAEMPRVWSMDRVSTLMKVLMAFV